LLAIAIVSAVAALGSSSSLAYDNGRWCAFLGMGSGVVRSVCHFNDFNACVAEAIAGDRGHCGPNPNWSGAAAKPVRRR
jgi:hypothetical protein